MVVLGAKIYKGPQSRKTSRYGWWGCDGSVIVFPRFEFLDSSFHNDDCLAISLDSTDAAAHDCYRIKNKGRVYELENSLRSQVVPAERQTWPSPYLKHTTLSLYSEKTV